MSKFDAEVCTLCEHTFNYVLQTCKSELLKAFFLLKNIRYEHEKWKISSTSAITLPKEIDELLKKAGQLEKEIDTIDEKCGQWQQMQETCRKIKQNE